MGIQSYLRQCAARRTGPGPFSGVTGGRAPSFHGLSMGEAPGPERMRGEQREGAELPRRQAVEKTSPGDLAALGGLGTQEKGPGPVQSSRSHVNTFERY